jgi:hypothetical protein
VCRVEQSWAHKRTALKRSPVEQRRDAAHGGAYGPHTAVVGVAGGSAAHPVSRRTALGQVQPLVLVGAGVQDLHDAAPGPCPPPGVHLRGRARW